MLKKVLLIAMAGIMFLCMTPALVRAELFHLPTEVAYYDDKLAYKGVHLISPQGGTATYLIDLKGNLLHKWTMANDPNRPAETIWYSTVEENGLLSRAITTQVGDNPYGKTLLSAGGAAGALETVNWNGKVTWRLNLYNANTVTDGVHSVLGMRSHHRYQRIWNSKLQAYTYLFIIWEVHSQEEAYNLGAEGKVPVDGFSPDGIYEYLEGAPEGAQPVWKWSFIDHTCSTGTTRPVTDPTGLQVTDISEAPGRLDINASSATRTISRTTTGSPGNDWNHINSFGYDQASGHIVMNSRDLNEIYIIDHDGTFVSNTNYSANYKAAAGPDGAFLYRFGSPHNYHAGDPPAWNNSGHVQIWGAHGVYFINQYAWGNGGPVTPGPAMAAPPKIPWAKAAFQPGNFMILDNGSTNGNPSMAVTQLMEVNPKVSGKLVKTTTDDGKFIGEYPLSEDYVWQPAALYTTVDVIQVLGAYRSTSQSNQIVWRWRPNMFHAFNSTHISGVERLPNGNTVGTSGECGHIIELTPGNNTSDTYISCDTETGTAKNPPEALGMTASAVKGTSWSDPYGGSKGPQLAWEYSNPISVTPVAAKVTIDPTDCNKTETGPPQPPKMSISKFQENTGVTSAYQLFTSFRYSASYPGLKNRLIQYSDGSIVARVPIVAGYGKTLTGQAFCKSIPCTYGTTGTGDAAGGAGGGGGGGGGGGY